MHTHYFVIGDIHGQYDMLVSLLKQWDPQTEQLVFLGDYIDRGPDSKRVLERVMALKETAGAWLLKGNHEDMLLQWLEDPASLATLYLPQGGRQTLASFEISDQYRPAYQAEQFKQENPDILALLQGLDLYRETDHHVFVHAGIDPYEPDITAMNPVDFMWIRDRFLYTSRPPGAKRVVFGHTPTRLLRSDKTDGVWVSRHHENIGIDGGAVFGGHLIGLRIAGAIYEAVSIDAAGHVTQTSLPHLQEAVGMTD